MDNIWFYIIVGMSVGLNIILAMEFYFFYKRNKEKDKKIEQITKDFNHVVTKYQELAKDFSFLDKECQHLLSLLRKEMTIKKVEYKEQKTENKDNVIDFFKHKK